MKYTGSIRVLAFCVFFSVSANASAANVVSFDYVPPSHWDVPFPSDLFTVATAGMLTGRRVNLPLPTDETLESERKDTQSVNVLDGFSIFPRITIPLSGEVPDVDTFTSANVFLLALAPSAERGKVIPIDQRVIDNTVAGAPRLIFAPDGYLKEVSRYAIVVTSRLSGGGQPFVGNTTFTQFINRYQFGFVPDGPYEALLYDALNMMVAGGIAAPTDLATLSVFTTRTVSDVPVKLLRRLGDGEFPIRPPDFDIDGKPGLEVVRAEEILTIDSYVHRASQPSDGSFEVSFPPETLRLQDSVTDEIYIENVQTGVSVRVPQEAVDETTGAIVGVDISALDPQPNGELAVLVRKKRLTLGNPPFLWDSVGFIAFGSVDAPRYTDRGVIPPVTTAADGVPSQTGTESIVFALFLPASTAGWPVVHLLHGGAESTSSFLSSDVLNTVPVLASRGLATASFTAAEFEGGPRSRVKIVTLSGIRTIPGTGRGLDVDGDGLYEQAELYVYPQRLSDLATILRSLHMGVDLNEDGVSDIAQGIAQTYVAGISYGGATAFISAALEPNASVFVANVPTSEGSRTHTTGFHPLVAQGARSFAVEKLAARIPSLLNGPSPTWGGAFNEHIPLKRQPVQVGLVPGAEAIQRALDFNMWRDLEHMPLAFAEHVSSGALRGGNPATLLIQVSRGDGAAVNPLQAQMIRAGALQNKTTIVHADNEPLFDQQWAPIIEPEFARHVLIALPYLPTLQAVEVGGRICHYTRVQIAEYLRLQGSIVLDPDGAGEEFAGDVFQFPVSDTLVEEMIVDPGLPSPF